MESLPAYEPLPERQISSHEASLATRAQLERISEPWAINRTVAIACTLILAMVFGSWIGSGQLENVAIVAVFVVTVMVIVFVQDYWWAPPLVLAAAGIGTTALGFPLDGTEIGIVILAITFPIKIAMKTLRKAEPEMNPGVFYWAVVAYVVVHCLVIIFYSKIGGVPLKNIEKSYYQVIAPLVLYGLLIRYGHLRTIRPTAMVLFWMSAFLIPVSMVILLKGMAFDPFPDLRITLGWTDADGAMGVLRNAPLLFFTASLAFWPTARTGRSKFFLTGCIFLSILGVLVGGGRMPVLCCLMAGVFFAFIRGKLWIALPFILFAAMLSVALTARPDLFENLPSSVQRSLAPLNYSEHGTDVREELGSSDDWHKALWDRSLPYWFEDTNSFWLGHGFKSWDPSIAPGTDLGTVEMDHLIELAVEMGATENMFNSITNIFGLAGLILYACFLFHIAFTLHKGYKLSPPGSDARAFCEFSLVGVLTAILVCCYGGYVPGINMIYWELGILAARPYLGLKEGESAPVKAAPEIPAFARPAFAGQTVGAPRGFRSMRS